MARPLFPDPTGAPALHRLCPQVLEVQSLLREELRCHQARVRALQVLEMEARRKVEEASRELTRCRLLGPKTLLPDLGVPGETLCGPPSQRRLRGVSHSPFPDASQALTLPAPQPCSRAWPRRAPSCTRRRLRRSCSLGAQRGHRRRGTGVGARPGWLGRWTL